MPPLILSVVATCFLLFLYWVDILGSMRKYYRRWKLLKQIPVPNYIPCHWLLGHIPALRNQSEKDFMRTVRELNKPCNKDMNISKLSFGLFTMISILDSKFVAKLLKEPKTRMYSVLLFPWLGEGLLVVRGKKWSRNRRLLTPAFHYEILKGYIPVYNSCLSVLLDKWSVSIQKGESVLLFDTLSSMSLDIIMQCAFSFKSDCQTAKVQHPYVDACSNLVYLCSDRIMNPLYLVDWLYWLTPHGRKTNKMCKLVHQHAENIIADRKATLNCNDEINYDASIGENDIERRNLDFLDILLVARDEEGKGMSDLEIRNEVDTFMFEGHDTTTSAMSWTLYCLAQHPQYQDKVREEVRNVLMGREWLDFDDLNHLNYTMWCIKEAMRLYPPVFSFYRNTSEEVEIGKYVIPKDITIRIATFMIHRNANIWENPMEYDPLRFQPDNMKKHAPYDYIPFSAGSRNCIGQIFAMNELKVVIGTIVNSFSLMVDENHHVEMVLRVVLRAKNDIKLCLEQSMA